MIFGTSLHEDENVGDVNDVDILANDNTDDDAIAQEVEATMASGAVAEMSFFEGGEDAYNSLCESAEVRALVEAQKMSKKTFVRLGKTDDLTRRAHLASLVLARNAKDPLFGLLSKNRVKERQLRSKIFTKYKTKAERIAKLSQKKHIKTAKALPPVRFR